MPRCKGKTKCNKRCKLSAMISDGEYCHIHDEIYRNYTNKYCPYDKIGFVTSEPPLNYIEECIPFEKDCEYDFIQLIYSINNPKFMIDPKLNASVFLLQFEEFTSLNSENDENSENDDIQLNSDTKFINSINFFKIIFDNYNTYNKFSILEKLQIISIKKNIISYIAAFIHNCYDVRTSLKNTQLNSCNRIQTELLNIENKLKIKHKNEAEYNQEKRIYKLMLNKTKLPTDIINHCIMVFF